MTIPKPARVSALVLLIASLHAWRAEAKDKLSFQVTSNSLATLRTQPNIRPLGFFQMTFCSWSSISDWFIAFNR